MRKLSDAQVQALVDISETGYTLAKNNTVASLEARGLITNVWADRSHADLTDAGREFLPTPEPTNSVDEEAVAEALTDFVADMERLPTDEDVKRIRDSFITPSESLARSATFEVVWSNDWDAEVPKTLPVSDVAEHRSFGTARSRLTRWLHRQGREARDFRIKNTATGELLPAA